MFVEFVSFFKFFVVGLVFDGIVGSQYYIFVIVVDVFLLYGELCCFVIVLYSFLFVFGWWIWDFGFFVDVDCDLFRYDMFFDSVGFGMFIMVMEKFRWFDVEVVYFFFLVILFVVYVGCFEFVFFSFFCFFFSSWVSFFCFVEIFVVFKDFGEVEFGEFFDVNRFVILVFGIIGFFENIFEIFKEVFLEGGIFDVLGGMKYCIEKCCYFFGIYM